MSPVDERRRRAAALAATAVCALIIAAALLSAAGVPSASLQSAAGLTGAPRDIAQTDDSLPASKVTMFGAAAQESAGEVFGIGRYRNQATVVHYTPGGGWSIGPELLDSGGDPLQGFHLDQPEGFRLRAPSPLAGQMTPEGDGALGGDVGSGGTARQVVLVREPGGAFRETPAVPIGEEGLHENERLLGVNRPPLLAALHESGGGAGVLVAPVAAGGVDSGVLHWDGKSWTREAIEVPARSSEQFEVVALGASSPGNAWLLARLSSEYPAESVALFRRHLGGGTPTWQPVATRAGGEGGEPLQVPTEGEPQQFVVPAKDQSQVMTVTPSGVWLDGLRRDVNASTTMFFEPEGEGNSGRINASWCLIGASAPAGTLGCSHSLPEILPTDQSKSFAWSGSGGLGERVITGLPDGQMLRLNGSEFERVLTLGGRTGSEYGAAFATADEGWLGQELLPVHLTPAKGAPESQLTPWPVPFRFALTAMAAQPGVAVGPTSSQVLAVGDRGEVARFIPGQGWAPETLPGPGGRRESPRLRAVAWPTANRSYAVGDLGQMWLWRGETGLWEKDPATPLNFRGNLLGIAFDPSNSSRGFAVGQGGVLLSYGKSWTQEPEEALPAAARGASFTSIAFAGSQAIVAYRKLKHVGENEYTGGVIFEDGSGWHEDPTATAALGEGWVPWAVAGLADGGAAFTAQSPTEGGRILERSSPGAAWQSFTYPGAAPGALTLFREGGSLRAIGTGAEPNTFSAEEETAPPPGFPEILVNPYPLIANSEQGVRRQTAGGWSDEEHELNDAREPPGEYLYYDTPYMADPVSAVLVDSAGTQGWAVGGVVDNQHALLDTADIYRYRDRSAPLGLGVQVEAKAQGTALAVGGGAQCAAPCEARAETGIGPDVWLGSAIAEAEAIGGVQAFLDTGPRVTSGKLAGPATVPIPYAGEEARHAALLANHRLPVLPVASATDHDAGATESPFLSAFPGIPFANRICGEMASCHGAYYAQVLGNVRAIMLDNSGEDATHQEFEAQLTFLKGQLKEAEEASQAAIVVAGADLPTRAAQGNGEAKELIAAVEASKASAAYFYESPEQNVKETLTGQPCSVPAFGSGTLGYVNVIGEEFPGFIGASGFLLAEVGAARTPECGRFPVNVQLIPIVGELAIEAQQGTLLRRSQAASFAGLARRPRSGNRSHNRETEPETSPYIPIPSPCQLAGGPNCSKGIFPSYVFESSDHEVGEFVERNVQSAEANAVKHNAKGERIPDPTGQSGLFCALNAGETTVTLRTGGRTFSLPVHVQAGSVRQPCGTTKLKNPKKNTTPAPPLEAEPSEEAPPGASAPLVPVPPPPAAPTPGKAHPAPPAPLLVHPAAVNFIPAFLPVPVPTPARPTPPSGTSAVSSQAVQKEEEEEAAPESVSNEAVAYRQSEHEPATAYLLGVILLAAFAGASIRGRPSRRGRGVEIAPATITTIRTQRRMSRRGRR